MLQEGFPGTQKVASSLTISPDRPECLGSHALSWPNQMVSPSGRFEGELCSSLVPLSRSTHKDKDCSSWAHSELPLLGFISIHIPCSCPVMLHFLSLLLLKEMWPHPHGEEPGTQSPAPESLPGPGFFHKAKKLGSPQFPRIAWQPLSHSFCASSPGSSVGSPSFLTIMEGLAWLLIPWPHTFVPEKKGRSRASLLLCFLLLYRSVDKRVLALHLALALPTASQADQC